MKPSETLVMEITETFFVTVNCWHLICDITGLMRFFSVSFVEDLTNHGRPAPSFKNLLNVFVSFRKTLLQLQFGSIGFATVIVLKFTFKLAGKYFIETFIVG